jgi:glutaredoxin 3
MSATIRIYTRRACGWCSMALALLRAKGVVFDQIDATGDTTLRRWLAEVTGRTTVPQIFVDGRPIGGYMELARLDRRGELDPLLRRDEYYSSSSGSFSGSSTSG